MNEDGGRSLPSGWANARIGEVMTLINGRAFKPSEWVAVGTPIIRIQNLNDEGAHFNYFNGDLPQKYRVSNGDLLFAWSGTPGTSFGAHIWKRGEAWLNQHIFKIALIEDTFDPRFLREAINRNLSEYIRQAHGGAGLAHITKGRFEESQLRIAPFAEQIRIADVLDELLSDLDAGVRSLEGVRTKLEQYRAAVLKAAVEGKLTADWRKAHPNAEPASELLKRILAERRLRWEEAQLKRYENSGKEPPENWKSRYKDPSPLSTANLPPLPERWSWATIEQLGDVGTGATPNRGKKARYYTGGMVPWITSSCVNAPFVREATECVTATALEECNLTVYPAGTLLLALYGEGRTRGKCTELLIECSTNQALAAIQVDQHLKGYLKLFLARNYDETRRGASGGVQPNLNLGIVRDIVLPLPPGTEQEVIVEAVEHQLSIIYYLEADLEVTLKSAAALRQSILKVAFEGGLVPQDPNDEPASALLNRIALEKDERERLAKTNRKVTKHGKVRWPEGDKSRDAVSAR